MENVSLRVYNHEIGSMIEGGRLDEAVAHCRHILETFPMHVETYRLLGKAFLEARRYEDAANIFQRVLMAVPDDFVSQVGMSIIRDDEGRVDDAIWHMERAFEVQPSNSAIQGELRRLYGRRDGVEPSKIRLSRDTLANMYTQGELFDQAIAEIRSILAEQPDRPDLQVMLMRAYYRSGQKGEAAEIASTLLKKYPNCVDALRLLVDIDPGSENMENTREFRHRLSQLDPYSFSTIDSVSASGQPIEAAANLQRLDYRSGLLPGSVHPDWASSLGIKLNPEENDGPATVQLHAPKAAGMPEVTIPKRSGVEAEPALDAGPDALPGWMRFPGQLDSTGEGKDKPDTAGVLQPEEPNARAEIPAWLMSTAPSESLDDKNKNPNESIEGLPEGEEDIPDWLKSTAPHEATEKTQLGPLEIAGSLPENTDESISSVNPIETVSAPAVEPEKFGEVQPAKGENIPEWLKPAAATIDLGEEVMEPKELDAPQPVNAEDVPDFLKSLAQTEPVSEAAMETRNDIEPHIASEADLPDSLKGITSAETAGDSFIKPQVPFEPQPVSEEAVQEKLQTTLPTEVTGDGLINPQFPVEPEPVGGEEGQRSLQPMVSMDVNGTSDAESEPAIPEEFASEAGSELIPAETSSTGSGAFPDWLEEIGAGAAAVVPPVAETMEQPGPEGQGVSGQPVTDQPAPEQSGIGEAVPEQPVGPDLADRAKVELSKLGDAESGGVESIAVKPGDLLAIPQDYAVEIPDWLDQPEVDEVETPSEELQERKQNLAEAVPGEPQVDLNNEASVPTPDQHIEKAAVAQEEIPPSEPPSEAAAQPAFQAGGEADTLAWLERMSSGQGTTPEEPKVSPEEKAETIPEVNQGLADTQPVVRTMEESVGMPTELIEPAENATGDTPAERSIEEKLAVPVEELPVWLKGFESHFKPVEALNASDDFPDWLLDPIVGGGDVPHLPKNMAPAEATEDGLVEPQVPVEPEPVGGEEGQGRLQPPVSTDVTATSDTVSEPATPEESSREGGSEPIPAETSSSGAKAFPDWMEEIGAGAAVVIPPVAETMEQPGVVGQEEKPPFEPPSETAVQPPVEPAVEKEDMSAWLERMSSDQGTTPEEPMLSSEEKAGTIPDVSQKLADTQPVIRTADESVRVPTGLVEPIEDATGDMLAGQPIEEKSATPMEELPDWLIGLENPSTPDESFNNSDDLPEWLRHPIPSEESVSTLGTEVPDWVDENIPVSGQAIPTMPEEWVPAEENLDVGWRHVVIPESEPVDENLSSVLEPASENMPVAEPVAESMPALESALIPEPPAESAQAAESEPASESRLADESQPLVEPEFPSETLPEIEPESVAETVPVGESLPVSEPEGISEPPTESTPAPESEIVSGTKMIDEIPPSGVPEPEPVAESTPIADLGFVSETGLVEETPPAVESKPTSETIPVTELVYPFESTPVAESDLAFETRLADENLVAVEPAPASESTPEIEPEPVAESVPAVEPEWIPQPPIEPTPVAESEPLSETKMSDENLVAVEPAPASESTPEIEPEPVAESVPAVEPEWIPQPPIEPTPVAESEPVSETKMSDENLVAVEPAPASESTPEIEPEPVAESAPAVEPEWIPQPPIEPTPVAESEPVSETKMSDENLPAVESAPAAESVPEIEPEPVAESMPAIESEWIPEPPVEPMPVAESELASGTGLADENLAVVEPAHAVETMPDIQPEPVVKSIPAIEPELISEPSAEPTPIPESEEVSRIELVGENPPTSEPGFAVESTLVTEPGSFPIEVPGQPHAGRETDITPAAPILDKDAELLSSAQAVLENNSLDESMKLYSRLIKKGHLLDEVIHDLREAIHRYPLDLNIWQTLGDAYMRANHLQDALDAYTRAEELLR